MASKPRRQRLTNLKRSFVVTISAVAAGASGCSDTHVRGSNAAWSSGAGGSDAAVGGGAGGAGGQIIPINPPSETAYCPEEPPRAGDPCVLPTPMHEGCSYEMHNGNPCAEVPDALIATCEQNTWSLSAVITTCNPPSSEPDSGPIVEDAGG